jgi:hypothetical protein
MPAQQCGGGHEECGPGAAAHQSGQRREQYPIWWCQVGSVYLTTQHADLVAQDEDLDLLGAVSAQCKCH